MDLRKILDLHKKKILIVGIPVAILLSLCIAFMSYCGYYAIGNKALPGVKIGSVKVHGETETQIVASLEKANRKIKITFSNSDSKKSYSLSDLGYKLDTKATAKEAIKYNSYFRALFQDYTVIPVFTIDGKKLISTSNELSKKYSKANLAVEPSAKFDEKEGNFKTVAGKTGIGAKPDSLMAAAKKAIYDQKDLIATITFGEVQPIATLKQANALTQEANKLLKLEVKINANINNTKKEFTADKATLSSWIDLPPASSKTKPSFSIEKSHKWLEKIGAEVAVPPTQGSRYVSPSGSVVRVILQAKNGIKISNLDAIKTALGNALKENKNYTGTLETKVVEAGWQSRTIEPGAESLSYQAAPGEKWIDVNLSEHTIAAYVGTQKVRGPETVYTGDVSKGWNTVVGTFKIQSKVKKQNLGGGNYGFYVPNVPNIMYFHGDYAIHGAPWTNDNYKKNNGRGWGLSHGCVDIPTREGLDLWYYNWASVGTVVRTHY